MEDQREERVEDEAEDEDNEQVDEDDEDDNNRDDEGDEDDDEDEDEEFEDDGSDIKVSFSVQIRAREDEWLESTLVEDEGYQTGEERFTNTVARITDVDVDDVDVGNPTVRRRSSGRYLKVDVTITIDHSKTDHHCELEEIEGDAKEFVDQLQVFEEEMSDVFEVHSISEIVATCGGKVLWLDDVP